MWAWRPFTDQLWSALHSTKYSNAPRGHLWTRQVKQACRWILAFLEMEGTGVIRTVPLSAYLESAAALTFVTDASPWGLGAVALRHGIPIRYLISDLTRHDYERYHHQEGEASGQQVWEALIILVAMRAWRDLWCEGKFTICLQGDNVTALLMALRLQSPPGGVKEVARELAL